MFRQQSAGHRSVQDGRDPAGLCRDADTVIPTYSNDTVVHVQPATPPEEDLRLLRETGRKLAEAYLTESAPSGCPVAGIARRSSRADSGRAARFAG